MATNFPASLDSLTNPTSSDSLNSPSHSAQHANSNDAIEALQAKVGADSSAVTSSLDYKIAQLEAGVTGGKILQVVSTTKTDTFSASVGAQASTAVTGLSITHTVQDANNTLLLYANLGTVASNFGYGAVGVGISDGSALINPGTGASYTHVNAGWFAATNANYQVFPLSMITTYTPGATTITYSVHVINSTGGSKTLYVNRNERDLSALQDMRSSSSLILLEVSA